MISPGPARSVVIRVYHGDIAGLSQVWKSANRSQLGSGTEQVPAWCDARSGLLRLNNVSLKTLMHHDDKFGACLILLQVSQALKAEDP